MLFAMFGVGPTEMIVIGIVLVLLFGTRLPAIARSLGSSVTEFKSGLNDVKSEIKSVEQDIKK
jgi:sec-independent protein translocase protein TatA